MLYDMKRLNHALKDLFIIFALFLNYASMYATNIIWNRGIEYLLLYGFIANFLLGIVVVNLKKAMAYTLVSLIIGAILAIFVLALLPETDVNVVVSISVNYISLTTVLCITIYITGLLFGCFLGDLMALADKSL